MLMYGRLPKPKGEMPDTSHKSKQCCITLLLPRGFSIIRYYSQQSSFSQCCDQVKLMYGRLPKHRGEMPDTPQAYSQSNGVGQAGANKPFAKYNFFFFKNFTIVFF